MIQIMYSKIVFVLFLFKLILQFRYVCNLCVAITFYIDDLRCQNKVSRRTFFPLD